VGPDGRDEDDFEIAMEGMLRTASLAQDGDGDAFIEWMNQTKSIVSRLVLRMLGDLNLTEDVVQEVYARAWNNMTRLEKPGASLGWVCKIARRIALDYLKKSSYLKIISIDHSNKQGIFALMDCIQDPDPDPEKQVILTENCDHLYKALTALEVKYRVVLLLRVVDGMSYKEIATALGIPLGTVESWLHRARAKLREFFNQKAFKETEDEN
jgi:RNA polymerase sigma-70 factor (ECF subfamily)